VVRRADADRRENSMSHACRACLFALLAGLVGLFAEPLSATDYYLDCAAGADVHDGRSPETAWRNVSKVSGTVFSPGDSILLKRGTRCAGTLAPQGSGEPDAPITIGAWGEGPLPVVDGTGGEAAVRLFNQHHWHVESIETLGGDPYGIFISGDHGTLRHFRIRNVVAHAVTGEVKEKTSGLLVMTAGGGGQTFEDVLIDGVSAYDTTQWAGILVRGAVWSDKGLRARNVTIRNSIVHDVYGDGIVLFQVEDGLIETSAAWRTGLQPTATIGTPNGIWQWRCRRCTVQWNEGFFIDSPGVDGGVYDIDWGCDDNVVQYNFGHDAMGYCASVFGSGGEVTTNAVVRYNVCVNNGRSPKLARRQGDLFISTWEGGALDGVDIHDNTFYWNPPIDVPALQMDHADFTGRRPNVFRNNLIHSTTSRMIHSNDGLRFDHNLYWSTGQSDPQWSYGGRDYEGLAALRRGSGQEMNGIFGDPGLSATMRPAGDSPAVDAGSTIPGSPTADAFGTAVPQGGAPDIGAVEHAPLLSALTAHAGELDPLPGGFSLVADLGVNDASRSQLVFLQSALEQYGEKGLVVAVRFHGDVPNTLVWDWNLGRIQMLEPSTLRVATLPTTRLVGPDGHVVRRWEGLAPPADLGLTLRSVVGPPVGSPAVELPPDDVGPHHAGQRPLTRPAPKRPGVGPR